MKWFSYHYWVGRAAASTRFMYEAQRRVFLAVRETDSRGAVDANIEMIKWGFRAVAAGIMVGLLDKPEYHVGEINLRVNPDDSKSFLKIVQDENRACRDKQDLN